MKYIQILNSLIIQLVIAMTIIGCNYQNVDSVEQSLPLNIIQKIDSLNTDNQKQEFLEYIVDEDQKIRREISDILLKYGYDSDEHRESIDRMKIQDQENVLKIEYYLKKYGNPSIVKHGDKASYAPWLVIHHSYTIEARRRNFKYLFEAYLNKDLEEDSFSLYLNRLYNITHGENFEVPDGEEEIPSIITALNLEENN